jgi:hypothetical protein
MKRYFLAPRSGEKSYSNFLSTIKHGVSFDRIKGFLEPEGLQQLSKEETIYAWGNREGTSDSWRQMKTGDVVIFYAKGKLVSSGEVIFKQHSKELALSMWPPDEKGNPWEYTFFLNNLKYFEIPMPVFNRIVGYKENFIVQGFIALTQERVDRVLQQYASVDELLLAFSTTNSSEKPGEIEKVNINVPDVIKPELFEIELGPIRVIDPPRPRSKRRVGFIDFDARSKKNSLVGSKGEEMVVKFEKDYLKSKGLPDLAEKVERISMIDSSVGYDVVSYELDGQKKHIEVKSTTSPPSTILSFIISSNELEVARNIQNYYIYLVFEVDKDKPKITPIKDPFVNPDFYILDPTQYRVKFQKL